MNPFNEQAAQAGREFARANPNARGQNTGIFYRWSVGCHSGHSSGGMADTSKDAYDFIIETKRLYEEQGREVTSYAIYNQDDVCILSMDVSP